MNKLASVTEGSCLQPRTTALSIGLALLFMAFMPSAAWAQYWNPTGAGIYSNVGNVGIGAPNPLRMLHIARSGFTEMLIEDTSLGSATMGRTWGILSSGGTLSFRFGDASYSLAPTVAVMTPNGNVGIGTQTPPYRLSVEGAIGARDLIITNSTWPDYVFRPGYRLKPLSEVNAYIQQNHHLPDIPSEAEVKEKGVSVGEMQAKLLAKVEELTLHMIQQESENKELRQRIAQLETRATTAGR